MDAPLQARLFGGGAGATGDAAQLQLLGNLIEVRSARATLRVPLASMRVREVVSVHSALELAWEERGVTCAVQVSAPADQQRLRRYLLLSLPQSLAHLHGSARARRTGWWVGGILLATFVALPVLLLVLFISQADRVADAVATRIPIEREQQLGQQVFATMRGRLRLQPDGPATNLVRSIGATLTGGSRFQYTFHVVEDESLNAFALPGGIVVVHSGLIDAADRPEQLAGVLAHEVQHVEQRHSLTAIIKELGVRGLWAAFTGDVAATIAGQAAMRLTSLRFSRDAEREADARAFDALLQHQIDPRGMMEFFGTMAQQSGPAPPAWLSTHPASSARQEQLRTRVEQLQARVFPPLEPQQWAALRP